jgi:integrase
VAGYYTGARLGDLSNLRWNAIDLKTGLIVFTASKTKKPVTIPLHAELEQHLLKTPGVGGAFVFPSLAGRGTGGKLGLSGQFAAIMARAGIEGKITRHTAQGRANSSRSFHSLRHSFLTILANNNVPEEVRMRLTGHTTRSVHQKYTHHDLEVFRAAIGMLPRVGDN